MKGSSIRTGLERGQRDGETFFLLSSTVKKMWDRATMGQVLSGKLAQSTSIVSSAMEKLTYQEKPGYKHRIA
jgi:hypothetical protein